MLIPFLPFFLFYSSKKSVAPKVDLIRTGDNPALIDDFVQIICSATGDLPLKFEWIFNDEPISVLSNVNIDGTRRSSTLTIEAIDGYNSGNYTCLASNRGGKAHEKVQIIVKGG